MHTVHVFILKNVFLDQVSISRLTVFLFVYWFVFVATNMAGNCPKVSSKISIVFTHTNV